MLPIFIRVRFVCIRGSNYFLLINAIIKPVTKTFASDVPTSSVILPLTDPTHPVDEAFAHHVSTRNVNRNRRSPSVMASTGSGPVGGGRFETRG